MKKTLIIIACIVLVAALSTACFMGCSEEDNRPIIGILQYADHPSLNNCYDGILQGLKDGGINLNDYKIEHLISNALPEVSVSQANTLVSKNPTILIAIATPSAIAAATAAAGTEIPVVYDAVTDVSTLANFENITGVCDLCPFEDQLRLVTSFFGRTNLKIGVLMSTEEDSDALQLRTLEQAATAYTGMEIKSRTVAEITTITTATQALVNEGVDCLVNLLDNTIVNKLQEILGVTNAANIPVFGSEVEQVRGGCLASASIDYLTVGNLAGKQAAKILKGTKASDVAPAVMEGHSTPYYNESVATALNIAVPTYEGLTKVSAK